jgi:hypothetical protein
MQSCTRTAADREKFCRQAFLNVSLLRQSVARYASRLARYTSASRQLPQSNPCRSFAYHASLTIDMAYEMNIEKESKEEQRRSANLEKAT